MKRKRSWIKRLNNEHKEIAQTEVVDKAKVNKEIVKKERQRHCKRN